MAAILARSVFPRDWYSINVLHIPDINFPGFTCLNFPPLSDFRLSEINNLLLSCAVSLNRITMRDSHRLFLKSLMSKQFLSEKETKTLYQKSYSAFGGKKKVSVAFPTLF